MTARRLLVPLALLALVLGGCDEDTRDQITDAVQSAVDEAASEVGTAVPDPEPDPEPEPEPTEAPATEVAEPTPVETEEPAPADTATPVEGEETGFDVPWTLLLVLLVVALLVWAVIAASQRRSDAHARRDRLRDTAIAEADWMLSAARERPAGVDAQARARDVRMRLDRLTDAVQQLRTGARDNVVAAASELQTSARQLADALIARLDDAVRARESGAGLGVDELADRLRLARDAFAHELGRRA